jgi:hypothetical protein
VARGHGNPNTIARLFAQALHTRFVHLGWHAKQRVCGALMALSTPHCLPGQVRHGAGACPSTMARPFARRCVAGFLCSSGHARRCLRRGAVACSSTTAQYVFLNRTLTALKHTPTPRQSRSQGRCMARLSVSMSMPSSVLIVAREHAPAPRRSLSSWPSLPWAVALKHAPTSGPGFLHGRCITKFACQGGQASTVRTVTQRNVPAPR